MRRFIFRRRIPRLLPPFGLKELRSPLQYRHAIPPPRPRTLQRLLKTLLSNRQFSMTFRIGFKSDIASINLLGANIHNRITALLIAPIHNQNVFRRLRPAILRRLLCHPRINPLPRLNRSRRIQRLLIQPVFVHLCQNGRIPSLPLRNRFSSQNKSRLRLIKPIAVKPIAQHVLFRPLRIPLRPARQRRRHTSQNEHAAKHLQILTGKRIHRRRNLLTGNALNPRLRIIRQGYFLSAKFEPQPNQILWILSRTLQKTIPKHRKTRRAHRIFDAQLRRRRKTLER